jgi:hypothetical protein
MKRFFSSLTLGVLLTFFSINCSYSQNQLSIDQILKLETARFDIFVLPDMYEDPDFRFAIERLFDMYILRDNTPDKKPYFRSALEHRMILKGKSSRIKFMFDKQKVSHIEVEGVGETTPEDIKNGVFVATLKPEKTTLYKVNVHLMNSDGTTNIKYGLCNTRVIVVEDKKVYRKSRERICMLEDKARYLEADNIITSLSDGVPAR